LMGIIAREAKSEIPTAVNNGANESTRQREANQSAGGKLQHFGPLRA